MRKIAILLSAAILFGSITSFAAVELNDPIVNGDTSEVYITGTADRGAKVLLTVVNKGESIADVEELSSMGEKLQRIIQLFQVFAGEDGNFEISFIMSEDKASGDYEFRVSDGSGSADSTYSFYNKAEVTELIKRAEEIRKREINPDNAQADKKVKADELKAMLTEAVTKTLLGLEGEFYGGKTLEELDDAVFMGVANASETITGSAKLRELLKVYQALNLINSAGNTEEIKKLFSECEEVIKWKENTAYPLFKDNEAIQKLVYKALAEEDNLKSLNEVTDLAQGVALLGAVNSCRNWSELRNLYKKYSDLLHIDGIPTDVDFANTSEKIPFADIAAFEKALQNEIDAPDKKQPSPSPGGGGTGSSSSTKLTVVDAPGFVNSSSLFDEKLTHPFTDLVGYEWAEDAICKLYNEGIVNGKTPSTFDPAANVTREEFVKLLMSMLKINITMDTSHFEDVDNGMWYTGYVETAYKAKVINGISPNLFGVGQFITRQDMVVMVYNVARSYISNDKTKSKNAFFDEESIASYALTAVKEVHRVDLVKGTTNETFEPRNYCQRAEAAQIIYNLMNYMN